VPAEGTHRRTLRTPATPECLERVHALLADLLADVPDVADADRIAFETAVAEVVANVVEHGAAHGSVGLTVELGAGPAALTADLHDDGPPVDADPAAATMPDPLAERETAPAPRWTRSPTRSRPSLSGRTPRRRRGRVPLVPRITLAP
jgi:anti-sigma regulatory factor (Ser/Thr protein kinase)